MAVSADRFERDLVGSRDPVEVLSEQITLQDLQCYHCSGLLTRAVPDMDGNSLSPRAFYNKRNGKIYDAGCKIFADAPHYVEVKKIFELSKRFWSTVFFLREKGIEEGDDAIIIADRYWERLSTKTKETEEAIIAEIQNVYAGGIAEMLELPSQLPRKVEVLPLAVLARLHRVIKALPEDNPLYGIATRRFQTETIEHDFEASPLVNTYLPLPDQSRLREMFRIDHTVKGEEVSGDEAAPVEQSVQAEQPAAAAVASRINTHSVVTRFFRKSCRLLVSGFWFILSPFILINNILKR